MKKVILFSFLIIAGVLGFKAYLLYPKEIIVGAPLPKDEKSKHAVVVSKEEMLLTFEEPTLPRPAEQKMDASPEQDAKQEVSEELKNFIASGKPEKIMEHFATARKARAAKIQLVMAKEGVDMKWESQMENIFALSERLLPKLTRVNLIETDCRESICALRVGYDDELKSYKEIEPYMSNIGNVLGLDTWVHHDAFKNGGVIYFAKESQRLPELEAI